MHSILTAIEPAYCTHLRPVSYPDPVPLPLPYPLSPILCPLSFCPLSFVSYPFIVHYPLSLILRPPQVDSLAVSITQDTPTLLAGSTYLSNPLPGAEVRVGAVWGPCPAWRWPVCLVPGGCGAQWWWSACLVAGVVGVGGEASLSARTIKRLAQEMCCVYSPSCFLLITA